MLNKEGREDNPIELELEKSMQEDQQSNLEPSSNGELEPESVPPAEQVKKLAETPTNPIAVPAKKRRKKVVSKPLVLLS